MIAEQESKLIKMANTLYDRARVHSDEVYKTEAEKDAFMEGLVWSVKEIEKIASEIQ